MGKHIAFSVAEATLTPDRPLLIGNMRPSMGFYLAAGLAAFDAAVAATAAATAAAAPDAAHDQGKTMTVCHKHTSSRDHVGLVQECIRRLDEQDLRDALLLKDQLQVGRCNCKYVSEAQGAWPEARDYVLENFIAEDETCSHGDYLKLHEDKTTTMLEFSCEEESGGKS